DLHPKLMRRDPLHPAGIRGNHDLGTRLTVFDDKRVGGVRRRKWSEQNCGDEGEQGFHVLASHFGAGFRMPIRSPS
ncbi:MAG: hypothetical protein KDA59_14175, partial [Planctomycetales bacterium]|nr:hypothetical protein [Planctomycetales bacterium]